jgi:uncharacterized repeat protein (TIGR01451 family)
LDSSAATTDLGVGITGDKSSLNIGDTVKLTINAFNNGLNPANVKVNYKIPFGLKLLSSQGTGTYDSNTGIWDIGVLPAGENATIELTLQVNNAGSLVNTATVYSNLPDLNPADNQATYNLAANDPNLGDIPSGGLNGLPYTFPDDVKPSDPGNGSGSSGGSGGSGESGGSGGSGPGGNGPGGSNPGPSSPPTSQLGRDIAGVRDIVGYTPSNDQNGNQTTQPPQIPEWTLDTSILTEILIAASMLATSAVAARFLSGETGGLKNNFGKWATEKFGYDKPSIKSMVLYIISTGLFALEPDLVDGILLFVGMFGFFFDFIAAMIYSGAMDYFGYLLLSIAIIKLVEKYWGLDVVQMASDKLGELKEIFTNELGPIFDHLKEMFGFR